MKYLKYFTQFILIMILLILFKILGYKKASNVGSIIGRFFGKIIRTDRIIKKNINIIKNNSNLNINENQVVNEVFENYGRILSEYVYLDKFKNGTFDKYININGKHYLDEIKIKKKKVIFVSGHFNNFELMAMYLDTLGINLAAIYRPLNNIFLNKVMERIRLKYICKNQIKKGKSGTRKLVDYIKKNYSIALMIDQRVTEGIKSDLFGKPAYTTTIPAQIIRKFDCEIVPVFIERYDNLYFNLTIDKPIKFDRNDCVEKITLELNKLLEKMILKNPSQWILTHNRWK